MFKTLKREIIDKKSACLGGFLLKKVIFFVDNVKK